jgi:hypothetical protein
MPLAATEIEQVARLLIQGNIGDANSCWNSILLSLSATLQAVPKTKQVLFLPALRQILACQQSEDWIGMADGLRYELLPLLTDAR